MQRKTRISLTSNLTLIFALALWGFSMFLVFEDNYATNTVYDLSDIPLDGINSDIFQNWMDVRLGGAKIGYTMQSFGNTPLGYTLKDYSLVKIPMGGTVREVYLDSYAILNVDYSLKNFAFGLVSGDYTTDVYGEVSNGKLLVKVLSQSNESAVTFDASKGIYLPAVVPLMAKAKGFPVGKFSLPTFDPFSLVTNDLEVHIDSLEEVETGFGKMSGYRLSLVFSGVSSHMWVDKSGRVIREEETGGMEIVAVSKEEALDMPYVENIGGDLLDELAVSCEGEIPDPRNLTYLKVLINGIKPEFFDLSDDFQTVVSTDPLILEIHPSDIKPSEQENYEAWLKSETFVQVEDARIKKAASDITSRSTDNTASADAIGEWVFKNIEKDYAVSLPSAVDVLEVRKGDCNEHTSLYTALARAAGIPTKICIGVVYKDGLFYYHAWPAVYLNGWRPMDPTFGQDLADATHIKILEGGFERQADLLRVVGKMSVTVLETSKRDENQL
jgi:hypothetical protein